MKVPFLDLKAQHDQLSDEIHEAICDVMDSSAFAGGPFVAKFEEEFAEYCGGGNAIGVGNGTEALWLALLALGVGKGDEVITVPNTFIATAEAIMFCGAKPVFVDVDERHYTMRPDQIERAITPRTRAIIPVHLFGHMADMDPIMELAQRNGLWVIEDTAQAHGAEYKGKKAGTIGCVGCFSFYPSKNLGACGEAGAVVTNNDYLARQIKALRDHGQTRKYTHSIVGWNARMDGLQAAILSVKLKRLNEANEARRANAKAYAKRLGRFDGIVLPQESEHMKHVYHVYSVRVKGRDEFMASLSDKGVGCAVHYPIPIHLQDAFSHLGLSKGLFPVTETCAREFVSLPMFPELTQAQIDHVAKAVEETLAERNGAARRYAEEGVARSA